MGIPPVEGPAVHTGISYTSILQLDGDGDVLKLKVAHLGTWPLLALTVGILSGCGALRPDVPEPEQFYCTWSSQDGAEVEFGMYGRLDYRDLPIAIVEYPFADGDESTVSGSGVWSYGNGLHFRDVSGDAVVTLLIGEEAWTLRIVGTGDDMKLAPLRTEDRDAVIADWELEKESCPPE